MSQTIPIAVYGDVDPRAVEQLRRCAEAGDAYRAALCADGHVGYSQPIGGVVAYKDYISPSGIGFDIACGNKAVATNLFYGDIKGDLPKIMDEVFRRISFGMGQGALRSWAPSVPATTTSISSARRGPTASGSACTSARAASATRSRLASSRSRRGAASMTAPKAARCSPRRRCCTWARRSATPTSRR
jgi:hypothetical protein